jgi:hypothetical protein
MTTQNPIPASTVVLMKITTDWPYKILLLKRSPHAKFLPSAHVFPGGRLEHSDHAIEPILRSDNHNCERFERCSTIDLSRVLHHLAGGIRETLEEAAISILRIKTKYGASSLPAHELSALLADPQQYQEQLRPALDNIWPISWWITPSGETRRFDTWFFLALVETDQEAKTTGSTPSDQENVERLWISPQEALRSYNDGHIFLAPPTRTVIERLANTSSLEDFLSFVDKPLRPIRPFFIESPASEKTLVLPGDPLHPEETPSRLPLSTSYKFP